MAVSMLLFFVFIVVDAVRGFTVSAAHVSSHRPIHLATTRALPEHVNGDAATLPSHVPCVIKVMGVGGGGGNAVNHMIEYTDNKIDGVSFWAINTDAQSLSKSLAGANVVNIGRDLTRGLGAGGNLTTGAEAALENALELKGICQGADLVFITGGMGGGTGSGAAPILADIAKNECGCLTVGVVTKPFGFEGRRRMKQAEEAIETLRQHVDTLIVVSNDMLLQTVPENTPISEAFVMADDILRQGVIGITEIILRTGLVNVDFADVRSVMKDAGAALMGIGSGRGKNRAIDAAQAAISSPILEYPIRNAKRVVFNIVGGEDMGLSEISAASAVIYENCDENANIIFGALVDPDMGDQVTITVLACDFDDIVAPNGRSERIEHEPRIPNISGIGSPANGPNPERYAQVKSALLEGPPMPLKRAFKRPVDPNDVSKKGRIGSALFRKIF